MVCGGCFFIMSLDISVNPLPLVPSGEQQKLVYFEAAAWGLVS